MTHVIGVSDLVKEGPLSEPIFIANYEVGLQEKDGVIEGQLVLTDKAYIDSTPELEKRAAAQKKASHKGQFYECKVDGSGAAQRFFGKYETMRGTGEVDFLFRARKRWSQLVDTPIS